MTPVELITQAATTGVELRMDGAKLKAAGDKAKLAKWLPKFRERKAEILEALKELSETTPDHPATGDTQRDEQATQEQPDDNVIVRSARITRPGGERRIHFFGCKPSSLSEIRQWYPGSKIELLACGIPEKEKVL